MSFKVDAQKISYLKWLMAVPLVTPIESPSAAGIPQLHEREVLASNLDKGVCKTAPLQLL